MKRIFSTLFCTILLIVGVAFVYSPSVFAQESDQVTAKKYNISFPIAELGNCTDINSCKSYCDDTTHRDACIAFAKRKGFYKETGEQARQQKLVEAAKTKLGCTSETQCQTFCQEQQNFEKCRKFAQEQGFDSPPQNPREEEMKKKAKEVLGCESMEQCRAFCEKETNREKCQTFARSMGFEQSGGGPGGEQRKGPGGCTSEESCRTYCSDPSHQDECSKFGGGPQNGQSRQEGQRPGGEPQGQRSGPGGCTSKESCDAYCKSHPQECEKFSGGMGIPQSQGGGFGRTEGINSNGQPQNSGQPRITPEEFCRQNPDKCRAGGSQGMMPPGNVQPPQGQPQGSSQGTFQGSSQRSFNPSASFQPQQNGQNNEFRPPDGQRPPGGEQQFPPQQPQPQQPQQTQQNTQQFPSQLQPQVKGASIENDFVYKIRSFLQRIGLQ